MTVRERTEALFRFEETHPVSETRYRGMAVWPLMRLRFLQAMAREQADPDAEETSERVEKRPVPGREEQRRIRMEREIGDWVRTEASKLVSGNDLYLIQSSKVVENEGKPPFHRLFDSLIELTGSRENARFVFWNDGGEVIDPRSLLSPSIPFTPLFGKMRRLTRDWMEHETDIVSAQAVMELAEKWNAENASFQIDVERLVQDCEILVRLVEVFQQLLAIRPRSVFLTCYYSLPALALAQACRTLEIPCIEMQHGQQGDWHSLYTHRSQAAMTIRDFFPSHFWAWGESAQERMRKWWRPEVMDTYLGGNPWIAYRADSSTRVSRARQRDAGERKICMISMQSSELDEFVIDTIKRRTDLKWWFRLHPRHFGDLEKFRSRCETTFGTKVSWEVDQASTSDLYDLFAEVDVHLTGWSTTAHEAIHFGVPTVLIHPNGKSAMGEAIAAGVFGYAEDSDTLSGLIDSPPFRTDIEPLMRADRRELNRVFNQLVGPSKSALMR